MRSCGGSVAGRNVTASRVELEALSARAEEPPILGDQVNPAPGATVRHHLQPAPAVPELAAREVGLLVSYVDRASVACMHAQLQTQRAWQIELAGDSKLKLCAVRQAIAYPGIVSNEQCNVA